MWSEPEAVSEVLLYDPAFLDPSLPTGFWFCADPEDVLAVQVNAGCLRTLGSWEYIGRYVSLINELLSSLSEIRDYSCVQQYALHAIEFMPANLRAHYWLIVSTYQLGSLDLAKHQLCHAKAILTSEEYSISEDYLRKEDGVPLEKLFR